MQQKSKRLPLKKKSLSIYCYVVCAPISKVTRVDSVIPKKIKILSALCWSTGRRFTPVTQHSTPLAVKYSKNLKGCPNLSSNGLTWFPYILQRGVQAVDKARRPGQSWWAHDLVAACNHCHRYLSIHLSGGIHPLLSLLRDSEGIWLLQCTGMHEQYNLNRNIRKPTFGRAPGEDSDQTEHSHSLIRIFFGRIFDSQGYNVSLSRQWRFWSDCADAQVDLSLRLAHMSKGIFSHLSDHFYT